MDRKKQPCKENQNSLAQEWMKITTQLLDQRGQTRDEKKNPGPITKGKYILLLVVQWGSEITLSSLAIDNFQIIQNNNLQNLRLQDEQNNELKARINLKFKNNL